MHDACCAGDGHVHASPSADEQTVVLLKALAHPVRWRMLQQMALHDEGVCVCDLESLFALSQPTISHHLRLMRDAGVVVTVQRGTWVYYSVAPAVVHQLIQELAQLMPMKV